MSYSGNGYSTDEGLELSQKGALHTYSTENIGLNVSGNSGYVLTENPSEATGLEWVENAHSAVTASSTTTFTNKSIAFSGNTVTATLAELDTALSTTGTADATTYLRGDNSWSTIASGGQLELLTSWTGGGGTSPTFSANMETTYSELLVVANLYWTPPYTEFGSTYIKLNALTTGYSDFNGYYYDGTSYTNLTMASSPIAFVSNVAMDLVSGEGMHVETTLSQVDPIANIIAIHSYCNSGSASGVSMVLDGFLDIGSTNIITDLHYQASLAGWAGGSNFGIFGRKFT